MPRDLEPDELADALEGLEAEPEPPRARGSGVGIARGRSFGTEAGLIHGTSHDRILVGGVGYPYLADLGVGTVLAHRLAEREPAQVAVADLSHTPVASVQTIAGGEQEALLLVGAEKRGGELNDGEPSQAPGRIRTYEPDDLPSLGREEAARLLGQGAMGLITVENVIQVGRALDVLPEATHAITVEPGYDSWGMDIDEFTDPVEEALGRVEQRALAWIDEQRG